MYSSNGEKKSIKPTEVQLYAEGVIYYRICIFEVLKNHQYYYGQPGIWVLGFKDGVATIRKPKNDELRLSVADYVSLLMGCFVEGSNFEEELVKLFLRDREDLSEEEKKLKSIRFLVEKGEKETEEIFITGPSDLEAFLEEHKEAFDYLRKEQGIE